MARSSSLRLSRRIWTQLAILASVTIISFAVMAFGFVKVPALLGVGRYTVTVDLPASGGLYPTSVVNYRGSEVGSVKSVDVTQNGVRAVLSLKSDIAIPSDVTAAVHSRSAVGEQFLELTPHSGTANDTGPKLRDGDVIAVGKTQIPVDIGSLLDATNKALQAIPQDNLHTVVDEASKAVAGLGPELSRLVDGGTALAIDAGKTSDYVLPADRRVSAGSQLPGANVGFDRDVGAAGERDHQSAQGTRRQVRGPAQHRRSGARRRHRAVRPAGSHAAGATGEPGQSGQHCAVLPKRPRAAAGSVSAGDRGDVVDHRAGQGCQAGLQRHLSRLQLEPQLAATMQRRVPTGAAAANPRAGGLSRPHQRRVVLPHSAELRHERPWRSQRFPARPSRASAPRRSRCAKATSSTSRSTTACSGRAIPTRR